jgi:cytochrome P450
MWPECCRILIGYTAWIPSPTPRLFVGRVPDTYTWIPCSDGINCCIGTAFANMEMDVTLRIQLREFRFAPTDAPGERRHNRGVVIAPAHGGRAVVYRRTARHVECC